MCKSAGQGVVWGVYSIYPFEKQYSLESVFWRARLLMCLQVGEAARVCLASRGVASVTRVVV